MKITVYRDLQALETEWQQLQGETIFSTWTWCNVWWQHFRDQGELLVLAARDDDQRLIGIAPLMIAKVKAAPGLTVKQVQFIGASAPVEHFDFIIQRGREAEVIPAFLAELRQHSWDVLNLSNILPDSPNLAALKASGIPFEESEGHVAPVIDLPAEIEALISQQGKRTREKTRRYRRKIDKDFAGRWSCKMAESPDEINAVFDELVRLHQTHWQKQGEPGAFADPRMTAFYRDLALRFAECGWLRMYRLCADDQPVSLDFAFVYRDRFYHFINGTDFESPVESPGIVLHYCMIEDSIAAGVRQYDFMWGEESYKYDWGAQRSVDQTLTWLATPRARLIRGGVEMLRSSKQWLKEQLNGKQVEVLEETS